MLSAAHCFDLDEDGQFDLNELVLSPDERGPHAVVFELERTNGWIAVEYEVDSIRWPQAWPDSRGDLAVITLSADAPPSVPRYSLYGDHDEVGKSFVMAGYGSPGHGSIGARGETGPTIRKRAGLNRYEAIRDDYVGVDFLAYDFDSGLAENNSLELFGVESDFGFGDDETVNAVGDSGGPTFIQGAIAGVMAFGGRLPEFDVNDELDSSWGEAAFDTRVSTFREFIVEATDGLARFVTALPGDLDGDGDLTTADIDILSGAVRGGHHDVGFDINGDGDINDYDRKVWVHNIVGTHFGDANLDGEFNSSDVVEVFSAGKYEDDVALNSGWASGDWDGDGDFTSADIVVAFADGGYDLGARTAVSEVPEPSWAILLGIGMIGLFRLRKRR